MQILALDFDGVISDSAPESWLVTLRTYAELRPGEAVSALLQSAEGTSADGIREAEPFRRFVEMMPLGNRSEDYGVALGLLIEDRDAEDQASFDRAFEAAGDEFLSRFHERFYQTRARLRETDPDRWVSLLGPYPGLLEILRRRAGEVRLAIATAKDRTSVVRLIAEYGIDDLFGEDVLLDKEAGRSKRAHLSVLQQRFGAPFDEIVFVDDKVNHLDDVVGLGVRGALAAWGYNGEREQALARERGHLVCTLDRFEQQLFPGG